MTDGALNESQRRVKVLAERGFTAREIRMLEPNLYRNINVFNAVISKMRRAGEIKRPPRPGAFFSIGFLGDRVWLRLVEESERRHETPIDFARAVLTAILEEPVLLRNLLDEIEEREAAE